MSSWAYCLLCVVLLLGLEFSSGSSSSNDTSKNPFPTTNYTTPITTPNPQTPQAVTQPTDTKFSNKVQSSFFTTVRVESDRDSSWIWEDGQNISKAPYDIYIYDYNKYHSFKVEYGQNFCEKSTIINNNCIIKFHMADCNVTMEEAKTWRLYNYAIRIV